MSGFEDQDGKYPLHKFRGEPTVPRIARGDIRDTIITEKEQNRIIGIPIAMDRGTWDQPHCGYGAKYPYNSVKETESGHVQEFDDTPGSERIHTYHRSGTFEEITATGTKTTRIVGDKYTIVDRNGFIYIEGEANVTTQGNINIYCQSDANIEVEGSAKMKIGGNMDVGVAQDFNLTTNGNISMWANGNFNLQSKLNGNIWVGKNLYQSANEEVHMQSGNSMYIESYADYNRIIHKNKHTSTVQKTSEEFGEEVIRKYNSNLTETVYQNKQVNVKQDERLYVNGSSIIEVDGNLNQIVKGSVKEQIDGNSDRVVKAQNNVKVGSYNLKSDQSMLFGSGANLSVKSGANLLLGASGMLSGKTGGSVAFDGSQVYLNSGVSSNAETPNTASNPEHVDPYEPEFEETAESVKALVNGMIPPPCGSPSRINYTPIYIPQPFGEDEFLFELPEETQGTTAKKSLSQIQASQGVSNTTQTAETKPAPSSSGTAVETSRKQEIESTDSFNANFKLSEHFTLGMLFDGGFNRKHKLVNQCGLTKSEIVTNLSRLCENVLEKYIPYMPGGIEGYGKQWRITSGYRMGSGRSDHNKGRACDIQLTTRNKRQHYELIQQLAKVVDYDQLLLEYRGAYSVWIHTGFRYGENRRQAFTMVNDRKVTNGFTLYG